MEVLVDRIVHAGNAFFRHQQVEEEELTIEDKKLIVNDLFKNNKSLFLQRYNKFLSIEDCCLFDKDDDFMVQHFIAQVKKERTLSSNGKHVRNRRYIVLQKLKSEGKYFSDEKMREREPLLFDKMIGKYLSETDRIHLRPTVERPGGWAGMIDQFAESMEVSDRRNEHDVTWDRNETDQRRSRMFAHVANKLADDDEFVADMESDEEDSQDEKCGMGALRKEVDQIQRDMMEECDDEGDDESPETKRQEFESFMEDRFLTGKDSIFFDYSTVDEDESLDDRDPIRERELQEKWFDEEEDDE